MYYIKQEEPEGWQKAFVIYFANKRIMYCSYLSTAISCIKTEIEMCQYHEMLN